MRRLLPVALIVAGVIVLVAGRCGGGPGQQASSASTSTVAPAPDAAPGDEPAAGPPPTLPTTTSTTTTAPGMAQTDQLERAQPITAWLPHDEVGWSIAYTRTGPSTLTLTITVKAILNGERDLPAYKARLAAGHDAALAYLRAHGADPASFAVTWVPAEAGR